MTHTINRNKIKNKQDRFNNRSGLYGSHTTDEPQAYTKIMEFFAELWKKMIMFI